MLTSEHLFGIMYNMKNELFYKKCCFTGYRPSKFPFKLQNDDAEYSLFIKRLYTTIESLIEDECFVFYSGMAMGFDIIAAEAVLNFKEKMPNIKLICAVPFENQEISFPAEWKKRYRHIINSCDDVLVLSQEYYNGCYQNRNKFMVDSSDYILTWYDGLKGGTRNTLLYAEKTKKYIVNLNISYIKEFNNKQMNIDI